MCREGEPLEHSPGIYYFKKSSHLVCNKSLPQFSKTFILQKWHLMMPDEPLTHFTTLLTARNHFSPTDLVYFILKIKLRKKKKKLT